VLEYLQVIVHKTVFNTVFLMRQHCIQYIIQFRGHAHFEYGVKSAPNGLPITMQYLTNMFSAISPIKNTRSMAISTFDV